VFNRISYPIHHSVDQLASRSNSSAEFARRSQFQNYSNSSNSRFERLNIRSSLRGSRVRPWASRNLIWWPKKILKHHPEISGHKFVSSINGPPGPVMNDSRITWGNSISGNNRQLFGISGQNCRRPFDFFPSKFENVSWEYSSRPWFRASLPSPAGGPSPPPFFNNFGEFAQVVLTRSGSSPFTELALFTKPSSTSLSWKSPSPSSPHLCWECSSHLRLPPHEVFEEMVFHRVDPAPFLPHGFVAQQVDHREIMVRTMTRPQPSTHEDWGIVLVQPLPEHEVNFHIFDDIIGEYLMGVRHIQVRSIQRSHLGQALMSLDLLLTEII
jgi:hypothetical protein